MGARPWPKDPLFQALADPSRRAILKSLMRGESHSHQVVTGNLTFGPGLNAAA